MDDRGGRLGGVKLEWNDGERVEVGIGSVKVVDGCGEVVG